VDAGAMQIQLEEGERNGVYRGCAAEHSPSHRQTKGYLEQEDIAKMVVAEA
jgi:hypothetical protein